MRTIERTNVRSSIVCRTSRSGVSRWPAEILGGFDPPIQHHPYWHSTANRVPAVGRNKIDPVNLDLLLPSATRCNLRTSIRMWANPVRHYSRGTRLSRERKGESEKAREEGGEGEDKGKRARVDFNGRSKMEESGRGITGIMISARSMRVSRVDILSGSRS